jgi:hypothetical protein
MTETAPCPWCEDGGKPFLHLSRDPFMSYAVRCYTCHATGPHVKFEPTQKRPWLETIEQPQIEAKKLWNKRALPEVNRLLIQERYKVEPSETEKLDAKSSENREGDEPSDAALAATA